MRFGSIILLFPLFGACGVGVTATDMSDGSVDTGLSDADSLFDSQADVTNDGSASNDASTDHGNDGPGPTIDPNCGDGQREQLETCDDGNLRDGDGCSANCDLEVGWLCTDTAVPYLPLEGITADGQPGEQTFTFNLTDLPTRDIVVYLGGIGGIWVNDVAPIVDNDAPGFGLIVRLPRESFRVGENALRVDVYSVGRFNLAHQSVCSPLGPPGPQAVFSPQISWGSVTDSCASSGPVEFSWPEVPTNAQSVRFEVRDVTNLDALLYESLYPLSPEQRSITFGGNVPRHDMPGCFGNGRHALEFRVVAYEGPFGGTVLQVMRLIAYSEARPAIDSAAATPRIASRIVEAVDVAAPQRSDVYVSYIDLTGDGRADRIVTGSSDDYWKVDRNVDGAFGGVPESWNIPRVPGSPTMRLRLIDMDGDGRLDLISLPSSVAFSAIRMFRNTGHGFAPARHFRVPSEFMRAFVELNGGHAVPFNRARSDVTYVSSVANVIDLNGDRIADLCVRQGTALRVWFGTGSGWSDTAETWSFPTGDWFWFDLNGDDVQELVSGTMGQPNMLVRWGTGSGYADTNSTLNGNPQALSPRLDDPNYPVTASWSMFDINGDGNLDMVNVGQSRVGASPFPEESGGEFAVWGFNTGNFHYRVYLGNGGGFATNYTEWRLPQNFYLTTGRIHQSGTGPGIQTIDGCASWVFADIDGDGPQDILCTMHFQQVQDRRTMGWYWGRVPFDGGSHDRLYLAR